MKTDWNRRFLSLPPVVLVLKLSQKLVIPGFDGLSIYEVAAFFLRGIRKVSVTSRASSIAFNFFLATFPAILFFFTIIPYVPVSDSYARVMELLGELIPQHAFITIESTITDILTRPRKGLLSIGFLMALYFSTNGINSIIDAFNMTIHVKESRTVFRQRLISVFLVILLAFLTILAVSLITTGTWVLNFLSDNIHLIGKSYLFLLQTGKWLVIIALLFFTFSFLYYFGPVKKSRYRFFSAGSTLATLLTLATSLGFDFYISNFSSYNALYGSIGTLIILLLWMYFNSIILLLGFELNASILSASEQKNLSFNRDQHPSEP
ncbi:MAG TPA: YihY/virulence factor BrkB family protein [Bacteroidales bacterium]|nr:YihY/virulence factor BrkB family protein [Bacteroidales bacterium]HSA43501.1 YihY/virulence factor BrkB family protein [Bacteroidales bacterium]